MANSISSLLNAQKKGWWSGSSRRAPAQQVLGLEFKLEYCPKNEKKEAQCYCIEHTV
jgi:hypothetical protein